MDLGKAYVILSQTLVGLLLATSKFMPGAWPSKYTVKVFNEHPLEILPTVHRVKFNFVKVGERSRLECHWKEESLVIIASSCEFHGL